MDGNYKCPWDARHRGDRTAESVLSDTAALRIVVTDSLYLARLKERLKQSELFSGNAAVRSIDARIVCFIYGSTGSTLEETDTVVIGKSTTYYGDLLLLSNEEVLALLLEKLPRLHQPSLYWYIEGRRSLRNNSTPKTNSEVVFINDPYLEGESVLSSLIENWQVPYTGSEHVEVSWGNVKRVFKV